MYVWKRSLPVPAIWRQYDSRMKSHWHDLLVRSYSLLPSFKPAVLCTKDVRSCVHFHQIAKVNFRAERFSELNKKYHTINQ